MKFFNDNLALNIKYKAACGNVKVMFYEKLIFYPMNQCNTVTKYNKH